MLLNDLLQMYYKWLELGRGTPATNQTMVTARSMGKLFLKYLGNKNIQIINQDSVTELKQEMLSRSNCLRYIERNLIGFRMILKFARDELGLDVLDPKDVKLPKRTPHVVDYLSKSEVLDILEYVSKHTVAWKRIHALIAIILDSGMRISEVLSLNISSIDFKQRQAIVMGKGRKERIIFFHSWSLKIVQAYLKSRTDTNLALFVSHPLVGDCNRWNPKRVQQYFSMVSKATRIHITPHKLRRTSSTHFRHNGGDTHDIQHFLGHSKIETTEYYLGVDWEKVREAHFKYVRY